MRSTFLFLFPLFGFKSRIKVVVFCSSNKEKINAKMARSCSRLVLLSLVSLVLVVGVMATHETVEEEGRQQGHKFERAFKALFLSQPSGEFLVAEVLRTFLDANQTRAYHAIPVGFHPLRTTGNNDGVGNLRASIGGLLVPERSISAIDLFGASSPKYPFFSVLEQV